MENNWPKTVEELLEECEHLSNKYDLYTLGERGVAYPGETEPRVDGTDYLAGEYKYGVAMIPAQWVSHVLSNATLGSERHPYEQRIKGDGSNWGEIMRGAYDDLMAAANDSCTPDELVELEAYISESNRETCHAESDLSEWVCSRCQCWIPLGLTPENINRASEWRYCPHCRARVERGKAVKR